MEEFFKMHGRPFEKLVSLEKGDYRVASEGEANRLNLPTPSVNASPLSRLK